MSMETTVTGNIAAPELKFTGQGKAVLELRINATRRAKNKDTGEWADDGAQLWISATFWDKEAENLAETLSKGSKVTVSGTVVMEEFPKRDGSQGQKLIIRYPRFLGVIPDARNRAQEPHTGPNVAGVGNDSTWDTPSAQAPF